MQAILFCGIQASGKSTFYRSRFFDTHVRISMDLLGTRNKETQFIAKCVELQQRFVIDNTNPTVAERARYVEMLRGSGYAMTGYYFVPDVAQSLARNAEREGKARVPDVGIFGTAKRLTRPTRAEGFDELFAVRASGGTFDVHPIP